jgi:hypothetical protein
MAVIGELLFYSGFKRASLSDVLRHSLENVVPSQVDGLPNEEFSRKSDQEWIALVEERCRVNPLVLKLDESQGGAEPTRVTVTDVFHDQVTVDGLRITKSIPFDGDAELFGLQPNTFDLNPPRGEVRGNRVVVGTEVAASRTEDAMRYIEEMQAGIETNIERQAQAIAEHNTVLPSTIAQAVKRRRSTLDQASDIAQRLSGR